MYRHNGVESSATARLTKKAVPAPALLVGVTLYAPAVDNGVPLIVHVWVLKFMPTGRGGMIEQEVMALDVEELDPQVMVLGVGIGVSTV